MIDRWLLSSAAPLEVYGPPGSARLVSGTLRAFHPVELAPVMIGGPVKPPLSRTALAHDLPSRLDAPPLIYHDALVRVIAVTIDPYHYPKGSSADLPVGKECVRPGKFRWPSDPKKKNTKNQK